MKEIEEVDFVKVEEEIQKLRDAKCSCSQATLVGTLRGLELDVLPEEVLMRLSAGLRGGIGCTFAEGSCGALTGAVVGAGLIFPEEGLRSAMAAREIYREFKDRFGSVCCGEIRSAGGRTHCDECCRMAGKKLAELYIGEKNGLDVKN